MFLQTCWLICSSSVGRVWLQCYDEGTDEPAAPVINFHTGTPRSKSTDTTPIVFLPSTVIAKTSYFALAARSPGPPAVGARRLRSSPHRWVPSPVSATPKPRAQKLSNDEFRQEEPYLLPSAATNGRVLLRRPWKTCGPDLAAQCATNQFGEAHVFASRFLDQKLLDVSGEPERHRHTAFRQFRSGHEVMCISVSYTSQG
jgi:hypothetical protein